MEVECPSSSASHLDVSEMVEVEAARGCDAGDVGATAVVREASSAFGLVVMLAVSPVLAPPVVSCEEGCIALPFEERSPMYVTVPLLPFCWAC